MSDKKDFKAEIKATRSPMEYVLLIMCGVWIVYLIISYHNQYSGYFISEEFMEYLGMACPAVILPIIIRAINNYRASRTFLTLKSDKISGELQKLFSPITVTLPLDKVSSLSISKNISYAGSIVTIATSSGIIRFPWVQNAEEFVAKANAYINEYKSKAQEENKSLIAAVASNLNTPAPAPAAPQSAASKIKELKDLLDSGLISNEEFEQKRKELLNNM